MKILIIGGSGGIGSALIKYILSLKNEFTVFATYRSCLPKLSHDRLSWFQLDASKESDVKGLSEQLNEVDIIINTIGFLHDKEGLPEKSIKQFNADFLLQNIQSNTIPTLNIAKYFSKQMHSSKKGFLICFSAKIGSIEDNKLGGWISYRCSKAALNMAIKTVSIEWQYKNPNCCVIAFHPGTTDTQLSKPFQKHVPAGKLFTPEYVAKSLMSLFETLTADDTGKFFSYDGSEIPW